MAARRARAGAGQLQLDLAVAPVSPPLVVAYGAGVDSTAMLIEMHRRGIRPDLILFADTSGESEATYAYLAIMGAWLRHVGFPPITIVRYAPRRARYSTLEGKCLNNETLPSLAFGRHSCSLVFKVAPQDKFVQRWQAAVDAWAAGVPVVKAIGYDVGPQDRRRRAKADRAVAARAAAGHRDASRYRYWYPLQDWNIDRLDCLNIIAGAGLPTPPKSACWFCPASTRAEVIALRDSQPLLFARAVAIETRARDGRHGLRTVVGLGRSFAWGSLATADADWSGSAEPVAAVLRP